MSAVEMPHRSLLVRPLLPLAAGGDGNGIGVSGAAGPALSKWHHEVEGQRQRDQGNTAKDCRLKRRRL